jgi:hypothetical protein
MRLFSFPIFALALSVSCFADVAASRPEAPILTEVEKERVVIGSLADIFATYDNGAPITIIHILEFSTDVFLKEPTFWKVRLCGNQGGRLAPAVHTNIILTYSVASHSRVTGCLSLTSSTPWRDSSPLQTVTYTSTHTKRSQQHGQFDQNIINVAFPK